MFRYYKVKFDLVTFDYLLIGLSKQSQKYFKNYYLLPTIIFNFELYQHYLKLMKLNQKWKSTQLKIGLMILVLNHL